MDHQLDLNNKFRNFVRRARLRRACKWLLFAVGGYALIYSILTLIVLLQQKMLGIGPLVLVGTGIGVGLLGFVAGWFWKQDEVALAREIDAKTGAKDRYLTSFTLQKDHNLYESVIKESAQVLESFDAKKVLAIQNNRLIGATCILVLLCAGLQFVNVQGTFLTSKSKAERVEVQKQGEKIERLTLEKLRSSGQIPQAVEAQAAQQLKLARDLKSGAKSKEEAMRDADRIASESIKQEKKAFANVDQKVDTARSALERMAEKRAIAEAKNWMKANEEAKADAPSPNDSKQQQQGAQGQQNNQNGQQNPGDNSGQQQTPKPERIPLNGQQEQGQSGTLQQLQDQAKAAQDKVDQLQKQLDAGKDAQGNPLTAEQKKQLQKQLEQAKAQAAQALELSKQAQEFLKRLQEDPDMQKLMQEMQKLQEEAQRMQNGEAQQLSKEELEQMQKALEELAEKYKDEASVKELIEQMREAAKQMEQGQLSQGMRQMMQQGMGQSGQGQPGQQGQGGQGQSGSQQGGGAQGKGASGPGAGGNMNGQTKRSSDENNKDPRAKANPTKVEGERRQGKNQEYYQEFFGPSLTGERGTMPYVKQLPNYTRQAENALNNQKISARHRKRVKNYFDTLSGRSAPEPKAKPTKKP